MNAYQKMVRLKDLVEKLIYKDSCAFIAPLLILSWQLKLGIVFPTDIVIVEEISI